MKLKDYFLFNTQLEAKFGINSDELHLLSFVEGLFEGGEVTIMPLLEQYENYASPATTHKRIANLVGAKMLKKVSDSKDTRVKKLEVGNKHNDLVKFLKEI
jgi:hypothetical protein